VWISIRLLDVEVNIRVEHPRAFGKKRHKSLCLTSLLNKPWSKWKMNLMLKEILARIQHKCPSTRTNNFFLTHLSSKSRSLSVCVVVCVCVCVCVCERERERERERETERQRDRETERQRDRETDRDRAREKNDLLFCLSLSGLEKDTFLDCLSSNPSWMLASGGRGNLPGSFPYNISISATSPEMSMNQEGWCVECSSRCHRQGKESRNLEHLSENEMGPRLKVRHPQPVSSLNHLLERTRGAEGRELPVEHYLGWRDPWGPWPAAPAPCLVKFAWGPPTARALGARDHLSKQPCRAQVQWTRAGQALATNLSPGAVQPRRVALHLPPMTCWGRDPDPLKQPAPFFTSAMWSEVDYHPGKGIPTCLTCLVNQSCYSALSGNQGNRVSTPSIALTQTRSLYLHTRAFSSALIPSLLGGRAQPGRRSDALRISANERKKAGPVQRGGPCAASPSDSASKSTKSLVSNVSAGSLKKRHLCWRLLKVTEEYLTTTQGMNHRKPKLSCTIFGVFKLITNLCSWPRIFVPVI